jgi:hypothetical protein
MNLEKLIKTFTILEFISSNPNCRAPDIRDFLGIIHSSKPNKEEKEFYQILTNLDRDGYVLKLPIRKMGSGGAHFVLTLTGKGKDLLIQIEDFSSKSLKDKGRYSEDKSRSIMLDSMLRLFSSESVDVIFDLIQEIIGEEFDNAPIQYQEELINKINESVSKISNKASEIAKSFF